jgi:hypothetical protein
MVKAVARDDGQLILNDGSGKTIADTYLSLGWSVLAVLPGDSSNEAAFIMQASH